jgi:hypothetical protein
MRGWNEERIQQVGLGQQLNSVEDMEQPRQSSASGNVKSIPSIKGSSGTLLR